MTLAGQPGGHAVHARRQRIDLSRTTGGHAGAVLTCADLLGEPADLVHEGDHAASLDGTREYGRREGGDGEREQHRWVISLSCARHHPRHDQRERSRQPQPVAAESHSGAQTR
jgi:hypothetical protein